MNYAVIMAGGTGTRLWPMSRKSKPKQLHNLVSEKTLVQETFERLKKAVPEKQILVSTNPNYLEELQRQLPEVPEENFIVEPAKRNTGPALIFIALKLLERDKEATIATIASDHVVQNKDIFANTVKAAFEAVKKYPDHLVAVGINPTKADTGLGYIKMGDAKDDIFGEKVFEVDEFVEKPDHKTAEKYLQSWQYLWNGAYYFFKARTMEGWAKRYTPKTYNYLKKVINALSENDNGVGKVEARKIYERVQDEQFENSVVEQKDFNKVLVIPAELGWSDIGNWGTLLDVLSEAYNSEIISRGYHIDIGSKGCLVYGNDKMIATIGLKDTIVVDTPDVILIANKNNAQDVKLLLDKLKAEGKHLYL